MQVMPNQTVLQGRVRAIRPEADGWGANIELLVVQNESPSEQNDFLRPTSGTVLNVFTAEPEQLQVGNLIRAQVTLLAGPFNERVVLESFTLIEEAR
jgi:hypothetical protein